MNRDNRWFKGSRDRGLTNLKSKNKTLNEKTPKTVRFIKSKNMFDVNSESFADNRLETFTGVNVDHGVKKQALPPMFAMEKNENATKYPSYTPDTTHFVPSVYQENYLPFEQQRIGPGLGKDNKEIASGGFHDPFRILPDNVNSYRLNSELKGRAIFGKAINDKRELPEQESEYFDKTTYLSQRPMMPAKSYVDAPTEYNENNIKKTMKTVCKTYREPENISKFNSSTLKILDNDFSNSTRDYDATKGGFMGNPERQDLGTLDEKTTYVMKETDRGECGQITNANNQSTGSYSKYKDTAKRVQRQGYQCDNPVGILGTSVKAETKGDYNLPNTKRNVMDAVQMKRNDVIQGMKQVPTEQQLSKQYIENDKRQSRAYTPGAGRVNILPNASFAIA